MTRSEHVYRVIAEITGLSVEKISDEMSLCLDLGIAGTDGIEIIDQLSMEFDIDATDFDITEYIGPEVGFNPFVYLYDLISGRKKEFDQKARKLTVGHLCTVCEKGEWFTP